MAQPFSFLLSFQQGVKWLGYIDTLCLTFFEGGFVLGHTSNTQRFPELPDILQWGQHFVLDFFFMQTLSVMWMP